MRARKVRTIARRWWPSQGGDYDWARVEELTRRGDLVPDLIRELVRTGPEAGDRYVGTSIVEDLVIDREEAGKESQALELLLKARLTRTELFGVLSGVNVHYLESMGVRERSIGELSTGQIDWLLNNESPHRWSNDGTMVAENDGVKFVSGTTEWMSLYWLPDHPEDFTTEEPARSPR